MSHESHGTEEKIDGKEKIFPSFLPCTCFSFFFSSAQEKVYFCVTKRASERERPCSFKMDLHATIIVLVAPARTKQTEISREKFMNYKFPSDCLVLISG